eukprot:jgi/Bigna1/128815/aug1.7_g3523
MAPQDIVDNVGEMQRRRIGGTENDGFQTPEAARASLLQAREQEARGGGGAGQKPLDRTYEERLAKMQEMANVTDYQEFRKKVYKPKVSTWGLFERPSDISKAYGGGRTIKKGEYDKWLQKQNTQLMNRLQGKDNSPAVVLNDTIDAKKEKLARRNISVAFTMLENSQLYEARDLFQVVRKQFPFRTNLAGRATYGLALACDALGQGDRAQDLYQSLRFHPDKDIKKSAATMLSGFEAMEFFKVSAEDDTDYSKFDRYFRNIGRVQRFDLSADTIIPRTEEDIARERRDIFLSIAILLGFFAFPTAIVVYLRYKLHLPPVTPFGF